MHTDWSCVLAGRACVWLTRASGLCMRESVRWLVADPAAYFNSMLSHGQVGVLWSGAKVDCGWVSMNVVWGVGGC